MTLGVCDFVELGLEWLLVLILALPLQKHLKFFKVSISNLIKLERGKNYVGGSKF